MTPPDDDLRLENVQSQMRKGVLEYCLLLVIAKGPAYASDILAALKATDLIVVEGTIYPLLSRLKRAGYLDYAWVESPAGPPRKYYRLTDQGREALRQMGDHWVAFTTSVNTLRGLHEADAGREPRRHDLPRRGGRLR